MIYIKKKNKQDVKGIYVSSGLAPGNVIAGRMTFMPEVSIKPEVLFLPEVLYDT